MARAGLRWSNRDLAREASITGNTVSNFETGKNTHPSTIRLMRQALETAGIEFLPENGGGPGLRLNKRG